MRLPRWLQRKQPTEIHIHFAPIDTAALAKQVRAELARQSRRGGWC